MVRLVARCQAGVTALAQATASIWQPLPVGLRSSTSWATTVLYIVGDNGPLDRGRQRPSTSWARMARRPPGERL
jgi:hypothetical protein